MCGRLYLTGISDFRNLADLNPLDFEVEDRYNVAPGAEIPSIRIVAGGQPEFAFVRWGLIPSWAKDEKVGYRTFNARSETVATKPSFRDAYRKRRCILPVSGFYEWFRPGKDSPARAFRFSSSDGQPLLLAGLWESWTNKDSGEVVESATILTRPSEAPMSVIHHRMPVLFGTEEARTWIGKEADGDCRRILLEHPVSPPLVIDEVSTFVSNSRNQGEQCVEPFPMLTDRELNAAELGWGYEYRLGEEGLVRCWHQPGGIPMSELPSI